MPRATVNPSTAKVPQTRAMTLAVRSWEGEAYVNVWLLENIEGSTRSLMQGRVKPETADYIARLLGCPVIREHRTLQDDYHNDHPVLKR